MKKLWILLGLLGMLAGCGAEETFETIAPVMEAEKPKTISVDLPEEAILPAMDCPGGQLYFCNHWEIAVQTLASTDWNQTARELTGYEAENLAMVETGTEALPRREFTWITAGERGDRVGRAAVISDGTHHYCLSVLADAELAGDLAQIWNGMFESFAVK